MAEDMVVRYCAPTLAGIKTGGMFSCPFQDIRSLRVWLRQINRRLAPKGVRVLSLRYRRGSALIYVYRPGMLCRDLKDTAAVRLLSERGYDCELLFSEQIIFCVFLCSPSRGSPRDRNSPRSQDAPVELCRKATRCPQRDSHTVLPWLQLWPRVLQSSSGLSCCRSHRTS